ncbi:MAG TPA: type IV toxin-antitoxin system AbiEi family antitoxin domain-containing protein [Acidimicrobiia bacterium]|nr:type IV toxin-antitoxin system AbiEi family antitoxin domain-containing protein [Acidimicrobiia bacterium]
MDADDVIRELSADQYGAMSLRQLSARGISGNVIRRRIQAGHLQRVARGVVVLGGTPALAARDSMIAVLEAPPGAMISHRSAARWWGLPGFDLSGSIEVTIPRRGAPKQTSVGLWHYLAPMPSRGVRLLRGIPVSSPALMLLQLGAVCHEQRVLRAANNALARGIVTVPEIRRMRNVLAGSGRNGVGVLGRILDIIGDDYVPTDSGTELRLVDLASGAGIELERQVWVGDGEDRIGRADFRLRADPTGLIELLSFKYHAMFLDRLADSHRFQRMERAGFSVLKIWDTDVWNRPTEVVAALHRFRASITSDLT